MPRIVEFRLNPSEVREEGTNAATYYAHVQVISDAESEIKNRALYDSEMADLSSAAKYMERSGNSKLSEWGTSVYNKAKEKYKEAEAQKSKVRSAIAASQRVTGGEVRSVRTYGGSSTASKGNSNS